MITKSTKFKIFRVRKQTEKETPDKKIKNPKFSYPLNM